MNASDEKKEFLLTDADMKKIMELGIEYVKPTNEEMRQSFQKLMNLISEKGINPSGQENKRETHR